jgi:hypothetical protein
MLGLAAVGNVVLGGPAHAQDTDHALSLVPVSAFDRQVVAAQQALQAGDLGSMQEEALLAVVSASTAWDGPRSADAVTARRVLAAQHALASAELGSLQEEALTAIVAAEAVEVGPEGGRDARLFDAVRQ